MSKKKSFFIVFLSLKILHLKAQTHEKIQFKPRFSQTTTMGVVIPLSNLAVKRFAPHQTNIRCPTEY